MIQHRARVSFHPPGSTTLTKLLGAAGKTLRAMTNWRTVALERVVFPLAGANSEMWRYACDAG